MNTTHLTEEQQRAQKALELAVRSANQLMPFKTAAGILAAGALGEDLDDFLLPIEAIARKCFGGGADMEMAIMKATAANGNDDRVAELLGLHHDQCLAGILASFALGVACGRVGDRPRAARSRRAFTPHP